MKLQNIAIGDNEPVSPVSMNNRRIIEIENSFIPNLLYFHYLFCSFAFVIFLHISQFSAIN